MKRLEVTEQLRAIYAPVESMLADLVPAGPENEIAPAAETFKDVVGHLVFWDQNFANMLKSQLKLEPREVLAGTVDEINARAHAEVHPKHIAQIHDDFTDARQKLIAAVESFTDDDLTEPHRFEVTGEQSMGDYIVHEVGGHFRDHLDELRALWTTATG